MLIYENIPKKAQFIVKCKLNVHLVVWEEVAVSLGTYTIHGKGAARHRHSNCQDDGTHGEFHTPDRCWDTWTREIFLSLKVTKNISYKLPTKMKT